MNYLKTKLLALSVIALWLGTNQPTHAQHPFYEYSILDGGWVDEDAGLVWGYDIGHLNGVLNWDFVSSELAVTKYDTYLDEGQNGFYVFTADSATDVLEVEAWDNNGNALPITDHFLVNDKEVTLVEGTSLGWQLPGGLVAGQVCYVIVVDQTSIKLAATPGGAPIDLTDDGVGYSGFDYLKNYPVEADIARLYDNWRLPTLLEMEEAYAKGLFSDGELKYGPVNPDEYPEMRLDVWRWTSSTARGGKHYRFRPSTGEVQLVDTKNTLYLGMPIVVRSLDGSSPPNDGGGNGNGGGKGKNQ